MVILVHYAEIGLKGKNRPFFEKKLAENIKSALQDAGVPADVRCLPGRITAEIPDNADKSTICGVLDVQFGAASYAFAESTGTSFGDIKHSAEKLIAKESGSTFRIAAQRGNKKYPYTSQEINEKVGEHIVRTLGRKVDLTKPDITCFIEIVEDTAFLYTEKLRGPGGLPAGTGGNALALLSGGIDSPVAARLVQRRGVSVGYVHFHSYPYTDRSAIGKAEKLARILQKYQPPSYLYLVPFAEIQKLIVNSPVPEPLRVVLYRRTMVKISQRAAEKEGASALVTGESIGQVASQTLENVAAIGDAADMPILRPLIGFDKEEIIAKAREIGTYEISIKECSDVCSRFVPKHPATKVRIADVRRAELEIGTERLVSEALKRSERNKLR